MKKENEIIDADSYPVLIHEKKSAVKVSVPHVDKLIDSDDFQNELFSIKPRVCEEMMIAS